MLRWTVCVVCSTHHVSETQHHAVSVASVSSVHHVCPSLSQCVILGADLLAT